jgi:hypothetical protein
MITACCSRTGEGVRELLRELILLAKTSTDASDLVPLRYEHARVWLARHKSITRQPFMLFPEFSESVARLGIEDEEDVQAAVAYLNSVGALLEFRQLPRYVACGVGAF